MDTKDLVIFNKNTGEVIDGITILTPEDKLLQRQMINLKIKKEINWINSGEENFIFHLFDNAKYFKDISSQSIVRLVYLATYIDYSNNILCFENKIPLTKKDIKKLMLLTDSVFKRWFNEMIDKKYIIQKDEGFYITSKYFLKGQINKNLNAYKNNRYTRIYINAIRKLYLTTKTTSHTVLGYIFQLIPFVNLQWNIVCNNPLETDKDLINPLTVGEFCDIIGYDKKNAKRLIKIIASIRFEWKNKIQRFCSYIYDSDITNMMIFINPNIFYSGDNFSEVEVLGIFFK